MSQYDPATSPPWYRWYALLALGVVYTISVMDRSLLNILQQPIKEELGLADAQLGLLTGFAFAVFYATLAVPIARFADRSNRMMVLCAALALWSLMTAGCGAATGFLTLLLFRMGVGVGEAGGYPPSASVLSDYFDKQKRATVLAIFALAPALGTTLGLFSGGWLNETVGWRNAFYIIGGVGVVLAPLILFTVREPKRGVSDAPQDALGDAASANLLQVARVLWRLKTIRYLYLANMCHGFVISAFHAWTPPFYIRVFEMPTSSVANWLAGLSILGAGGTALGGFLADRLGRRDPRWYVWVLAASSLILTPTAVAQFLAPSAAASLMIAVVPSLLITFFAGPTIAMGQTLVLPHMRATSAAIMLMMFNIVGLGLGPFLVGVLSDVLNSGLGLGEDALRYAIVAGVLVEALAAGLYMLSGRFVATDLARDRSLDFAPETGGRGAEAVTS